MSEEHKPEESFPYVVRIKPGSSDEKSVMAILPQSSLDLSIENIINHVLKSASTRKDERIAERIKAERVGNYGITANGEPVDGNEKANAYFTESKSPSGQTYHELELVIAAKQEGGLKYSRY